MFNYTVDVAKKLRFYIVGFIASVVLAVAGYAIVAQHILNTADSYVALSVLGLALVFVQLLCFLRFNTTREENVWNMIALVFTIIVIMIVVIGSLWIMYNLNYNMMN